MAKKGIAKFYFGNVYHTNVAATPITEFLENISVDVRISWTFAKINVRMSAIITGYILV